MVMLRKLKGVFGAAGLCAVAGGAYYGYHDEGIHRAALFWSQVGPIYLHYKFTDWNLRLRSEKEREIAFNKLHDRLPLPRLFLISWVQAFPPFIT